MKIRTLLLVSVLALALSAFTLAENITPAPDGTAPMAAFIQTPAATATPSAEPSATETEPVGGEAALTPDVALATVSGKVLHASGGTVLPGTEVILLGFEVDADSNVSQVVHTAGGLSADGSYEFTDVEVPEGRVFLIEVTIDGVPFQSDYAVSLGTDLVLPDLNIYDVSEDFSLLTLDKVYVALDYSTEEILQVVEMYILNNTSTSVVKFDTDGTSIPFIQVPAEAQNLSFQIANGSASFIGTESGVAMLPLPEDQQYGLVATFELPREKRMTLELPFMLPVELLTLYAPDGVKVRGGEELIDQGVQEMSGANYHLYDINNQPADTTLSVKLSGQPAATVTQAEGGTTSTQKGLIIGLGTAGMALIGLGLFLFVRDRKRKEEDLEDEEDEDADTEAENPEDDSSGVPAEGQTEIIEGAPAEGAASPAPVKKKKKARSVADLDNERESLLDAIIALDEQFKAGEISREVYEKRRAEMKEELKNLI